MEPDLLNLLIKTDLNKIIPEMLKAFKLFTAFLDNKANFIYPYKNLNSTVNNILKNKKIKTPFKKSISSFLLKLIVEKKRYEFNENFAFASSPIIVNKKIIGYIFSIQLIDKKSQLYPKSELEYIHKTIQSLVLSFTKNFQPSEKISNLDKSNEQKILKLKRAKLTASKINNAIVYIRDLKDLFTAVCKIFVNTGKYSMAWMGEPNLITQTITPVAWSGKNSKNYLNDLRISINDIPERRGPTDNSYKYSKYIILNDLKKIKAVSNWKKNALRFNFNSMASFPIIVNNKIFCILTLYSSIINFFDLDEISFLDEIISDLSYAMEFHEKDKIHKIAEKALLSSEERFRKIFEQSPTGMSLLDKNFNFIQLNKSFCDMLGFSKDELIKLTFKDIISPYNIDNDFQEFLKLKDGKINIYKNEKKYITKKKEIIWGALTAIVLRDSNSIVEYYLIMIENITERKNAETALKESEKRFKMIVENINDCLYIHDFKGKILDVNENTCRLLGYKKNDLVGENLSKIISKEKVATINDRINYIIQNGSFLFENLQIKKDGTIIPVEVSSKLVSKKDDGIIEAFVRDISRRKQFETALKESEERYKAMFSNMNSGVAVYFTTNDENDFILKDFNSRAEQISCISREKAVGKRLLKLFPNMEKFGLLDAMKKVQRTGKPEHLPAAFYKDEYREGWRENFIYKLPSGDIVVIYDDVTERKEAEESLVKLNEELELRVQERTAELTNVNKELEAFSYSVSHDLRAPLRSINGFSQMLLDEHFNTLDKKGQDYLNKIINASSNLSLLINELLKLSRITRSEIHRVTFNLSTLATEIFNELKGNETDRNIKFVCAPELITFADHTLLRSVLLNLIQNAMKYTSKNQNTVIEFGIIESLNDKIFFIRDNGAGFDMSYAGKLFQPFQRLHSSKDFEGTGIGLATVNRIIQKHNGRIWAESEINKGATFFFTLE